MLSDLDKPPPAPRVTSGDDIHASATPPSFDELYEAHFAFVWRCARRLGVPESQLDDAVQDVYIVVHRQLPHYRPDHSPRAWLFSITRRVASDHRRRIRRKGGLAELSPDAPGDERDGPDVGAQRNQATEIVERFVAQLEETDAAVFVLSELEQMTAPETAAVVGIDTTTVYTRVRATRKALRRFVCKHYDGYLEDLHG